jgi:hypothetical protein
VSKIEVDIEIVVTVDNVLSMTRDNKEKEP